ncbi:MAG: DUF1295 domain-containing protein [Actinobacteria bacterium]|nr:DUF1295 domain-containing protein [Actinomycetota bacterium]
MELPAVLVILICFLTGNRTRDIVATAFLAIWMIHYIHRTFVYPLLMKTRNKTFPVIIILFSILFNSLNGYLNGRFLFFFSHPYPVSWFRGVRFITGATIFVTGYIINIYSDHKLRQLRKSGEFIYKIPYGGFYKYVSSPNYFGEILEWIGWAVLTWSLPGLAFAIFTIANLAPRALSNHKWYLSNFPDYPKNRKVLIPFVY